MIDGQQAEQVELEVRGSEAISRAPQRKLPEGGDRSFMTALADGEPLLDGVINEFDDTDWTWHDEGLPE